MGYPTWLIVIGSILSSVFLIISNKKVFNEGFHLVMCLTTLHFLCTYLVTWFMSSCLNLFEAKKLNLLESCIIGLMGVGSFFNIVFKTKKMTNENKLPS